MSETKHFVRFYFPGSFVSDTSDKEVASRDEAITLPERAYGYQFYDRTLSVVDGEECWGPKKNTSPTTYFGEVYDLARVKREKPGLNILIANMEGNGWDRVVFTKFGQTFPLEKDDVVKS